MSLYLLLVLIVVMVVFSKVQTNRRRKHAATLEEAIQPGVRVVTTAGIYGIVVEIEFDTIVLEISEGVDVRFAKAAVVRVVPHIDDELDGDADTELDDEVGAGSKIDMTKSDLSKSQSGESDAHDDGDLHAELDAVSAPGSSVASSVGSSVRKPAGNEPGTGSVSGA